ncbi:N-acetylmuramoyl-L-alanine amidase [Spirillospora sp. NPDC048911]|uniref:N-acetylmuramoyl-L-alanine amidase n=1 Tax=Spirillospora sp. NPDC048911 TaxID=3364527 RepID=UPI003722DF66
MFVYSGGFSDGRAPEGSDDPFLTRRAILGGAAGIVGVLLGAGLAENEAMAEILSAGASGRPVPTRPRIYTRREWGARKAKEPTRLVRRRPDRIIVHHTATPNSTDYSLAHAYRLSRDIQRFHMKHRGWNDTGQQLTISRGGYVMEGRESSLSAILTGRHVIGAQALHHNDHTIGIENEGNYAKALVPEMLWSSLVSVCTWLCDEYRLDPYRSIIGHRDYGDTDCPGDALYARLPELRETVSAQLPRRAEEVREPEPRPAAESPEPRTIKSPDSKPEVTDTPTPTPSNDVADGDAPSPDVSHVFPSPPASDD